MTNRILKQSVFLLLAIVVIFSGCKKEEIIEDKQEVENIEIVENENRDEEKIIEENKNVEPVEGEVVDEAEEDIEISDWLTYTNEEFGFSFKYPEGWSVELEKYKEDNTFYIRANEAKYYFESDTPTDKVFRLNISKDSNAESYFNQYVNEVFSKYDNCLLDDVLINNDNEAKYLKCFFGNEIGFKSEEYFWQFDDNMGFSDMYEEDLKNPFLGILQSFKFIK